MADANMYVLNPVFKADTFQEMVAPLTLYAQAYKEQEAKVEDMTDKAAALEWIANQNPDSQTAALYKDMSAKIQGLRDDIMMNGLTGGLRSRILGARRMYSANSAEITRRYEDMKKYQDKMDELSSKDTSMVFSADTLNVSLDDFAGGRRPKIKAISGNEIMARGAAVGKRLTSLVFGSGVLGKIAGDQFWALYKQSGMTDQDLFEALQKVGHSDKFNMVKQVIDGVYSSFNDFDLNTQQYLKNRFIEGVYSGATYARDVDYKENKAFVDPYTAALIRWGNNNDKRAQQKHNNEMAEYKILSGQPFQVGDKWYRYDRTEDKYYDVETGKAKAAPTNVTGSAKSTSKSKSKTSKKKETIKPNTQILAVDSDGNRVAAKNEDLTGTRPFNADERAEKESAWQRIRTLHSGEYTKYWKTENGYIPAKYHMFKKQVKDADGNVEEGKWIYYAVPANPEIPSDEDDAAAASQTSGSPTGE